MNMDTIYQALSKKFEHMGSEDFGIFIRRLFDMYLKRHNINRDDLISDIEDELYFPKRRS